MATDPTAPAVRSVSSNDLGALTGTSLTINAPSGIANGDVLLACLWWGNTTGAVTLPSGWAQLGSTVTNGNNRQALYYKVASGESGNYTWSWVTARGCIGSILCVSGPAAADYLSGTATSGTGSATDPTGPTMTTLSNQALVIGFCTIAGTTGASETPPAGWTEQVDRAIAASISHFAISKVFATAGATGTYVYDTTQLVATAYIAFTLALQAPYTANLTDTATLGESPSESVTATLSDALALAESTDGAISFSLADAMAVGESFSATATIPLTDSLTLSEVTAETATVGLAEAVTLSEATAVSASFSLSDALAVADALSVTAVLDLADALTLSESFTATATLDLADAVALSEAMGVSATVALTDSVSVTDALSIRVTAELADSLTITEALILTAQLALADALGVSESALTTNLLSLTDGIAVLDTVAISAEVTLSDSLSMTESAQVIVYTVGGLPDWPIVNPTKSIAGTVRDPGGAIVAGATVQLIRKLDNAVVQVAASAVDGTYSFVRDADDPYTYYTIGFTGDTIHGVSDLTLVPA